MSLSHGNFYCNQLLSLKAFKYPFNGFSMENNREDKMVIKQKNGLIGVINQYLFLLIAYI